MTIQTKKGLLFALITAAISGVAIFYNKLVLIRGIEPVIFNIIKNGGVALILTALLAVDPKRKKLSKLPAKVWRKLLLISMVGGSIPFILYFEGLKTVTAVNANLIHKTLFIWVALLALPILAEKLTRWQLIGYILVTWSNLFIGGFSGFAFGTGELMILAATILWSLENIIAKIALRDCDSRIVAWARMFFGSIVLIIFALSTGKIHLLLNLEPAKLYPVLLSIMLLSGYVLSWYKALQLAPATLVTSVLILATPITKLLTALFITHTFPSEYLINSAFTVSGILFILFISKNQKRNAYRLSAK